MRRAGGRWRLPGLGAAALALAAALLWAGADPADGAGATYVVYPKGFERSHVLLLQVDKVHTAELRQVYMNPEAIRQVKQGEPLPYGTRIVMVDSTAKLGADGKPLYGPDDRFIPDRRLTTLIQEKQPGWGDRRRPSQGMAGDWQFGLFDPEGEMIADHGAVYFACFECHRRRPETDYTFLVGRYFADRFAAGKGLPALPVAAAPAARPAERRGRAN